MNNITPSSKKKTSISVREMRQILGLNKVESYWLVHQNRFRTIVAAGRMRIMLDSFEEWYAGQFHYKKVNGEAPGSKWEKTTMSIREAAALLGLQEATTPLVKMSVCCLNSQRILYSRRKKRMNLNRRNN